jgi:hypothetical protein
MRKSRLRNFFVGIYHTILLNKKKTKSTLPSSHVADIKTGTFDRPTISSTLWTRHFSQYARHARARISSSWHARMHERTAGMYEPACMLAAAAAAGCWLLAAAGCCYWLLYICLNLKV